MEPLKSVSCEPDCGFTVRSHDEKELVNIVKTHAQAQHGKSMGDNDVKKLIKVEQPTAVNR